MFRNKMSCAKKINKQFLRNSEITTYRKYPRSPFEACLKQSKHRMKNLMHFFLKNGITNKNQGNCYKGHIIVLLQCTRIL